MGTVISDEQDKSPSAPARSTEGADPLRAQSLGEAPAAQDRLSDRNEWDEV